MADLTALDMAWEERDKIYELICSIGNAFSVHRDEETPLDCTDVSGAIRTIQTSLNNMRDYVFTINREQKGSDEAIQKQQMLYRRQQEREAEAERVAALEAELKPAEFRLD